ncbi:hypothetical protein [Streptomyces sp. NPDC001843]|uniref:hypothetical protein n=1 Tax=Streptomyces sp. NPDC001843 TaxID=3364617 RepID=UPI00369D4458
MTVRHVEHRALSLRLALPVTLVGPAFFLSSYLLSVGWAVPSGCRAAAVGLAATVTAWLGTSEWFTTHPPGPQTGPDIRNALLAALLPCAALAALSVALLRRGDSAGVWAVIPVIALAQAGLLLHTLRTDRDTGSGGDGRSADERTHAPHASPAQPAPRTAEETPAVQAPAAVEETPERPAVDTPDDDAVKPAPGASSTDAAPAEATPAAPPDTPTDQEDQDDTAPAPQVTDPADPADDTTPRQDPEPEPKPSTPQVGIDAELWRNLADALREPADRRKEQGGLALTARTEDGLWTIVGAVLPQQTSATSVRCEFSVLDVERVRGALDSLGPDHQDVVSITWLHTHPGLSVFLSATDHATSANWRALDPEFRPVVIDVTEQELCDQIGVFDAHGKALRIGLVGGVLPTETATAVRQAVLDHYRSSGAPQPTVLVGAEPCPT